MLTQKSGDQYTRLSDNNRWQNFDDSFMRMAPLSPRHAANLFAGQPPPRKFLHRSLLQQPRCAILPRGGMRGFRSSFAYPPLLLRKANTLTSRKTPVAVTTTQTTLSTLLQTEASFLARSYSGVLLTPYLFRQPLCCPRL